MKPPARARLLVIACEFNPGGAAWLALRHMDRLQSRFEIDLLVIGPAAADMLARLPPGVAVYHLPGPRTGPWDRLRGRADPLGALWLPPALAPFRRSYRAVLVVSFVWNWQAARAVALVDAPRKALVLLDEGLARYPRLAARERAAIEGCLRAADIVLPVSARLWRRLAEACPPLALRPWETLPPPVDPPGPPGPPAPPRDRPVVLTIARLSEEKNVRACVEVHRRLRDAGLVFRWHLIGAGPEEDALRADIRRHGLADDFILLGRQREVEPWLRACDVFALFSRTEGCPTVVREALQAGCVVLVSDVNGVDEMIDPGRTGLIVGHDVEAQADALARLLREPQFRDTLRRHLAVSPTVPNSTEETARLARHLETTPPSEPPEVTILIPTYNQSAYIDRAIASALMQDFPALEVVVADDASTDDTGERVRRWVGDPRFRHVRNPENLGRVGNYRRALHEHARGAWVLVLDGDDHLIDPGFIRLAIEALRRHAGRPVMFAQAGQRNLRTDPAAPPLPDILPPISGSEQLLPGGEYLRLVYASGFFTHLGALYDRRAAIRLGFYTEELSSSDMDSLLRLALEGEVLLLNTVAGCWVEHGGNASTHVAPADIAANARLFRRIARSAVRRGLVARAAIEPALTRYEAVTLAYLLSKSFANRPAGPFSLLRALAIIVVVNPRLVVQPDLLRLYYRQVRGWIGFDPLARLRGSRVPAPASPRP